MPNDPWQSSEADRFLRIVSQLDALLTPGSADAFWSARAIFVDMGRSFLNGWAAIRLKEVVEEKELLVFRDRNALTINITKSYAISLAMIEGESPGLFLYPQHYLARNVGRVPVKVRRYRPDRDLNADMYDPNVRLVLNEEFILAPGESLERDGYRDVLDWESLGETGFVLRLHSEALGGYEWAFDRETLAPRGVTVLDSYSSQMTTAMQMLSGLDVPVDSDVIEMGLASPYFHVRWETLKMAGQLTPERVQEIVGQLRHDPHPAIRNAAERTIQMSAARAAPEGE